MKTHFLFLLFISMYATSLAQTSLEEYNYLTKGYKAQVVEQGGDLKKGYLLEKIGEINDTFEVATLYCFKRVNGDQKTIAAYLIVHSYLMAPDASEYICVPCPNSSKEIMDKYEEELYGGSDLNLDGRLAALDNLVLYNKLLSKFLRW